MHGALGNDKDYHNEEKGRPGMLPDVTISTGSPIAENDLVYNVSGPAEEAS